MDLYSYFRSSASFRVRIALALKGLPYDYKGVHLVRNEQLDAPYAALSPQRLVPLLRDGDEVVTQSLAIIEYLDETHPEPPLLPADAAGRARVRSLALDIACEIHPLNNLRVLRYLVKELAATEEPRTPGTATGSRRAWRRSSAAWPTTPARARTATATVRRWPTACSCRRSSTRSASPAGSTMCRR